MAAAPARPAPPPHPLAAGPTTIFGEKPPLVDPVVLELARLLEEHADKFAGADPEVEVRLGVHRVKEAARHGAGARVDLPLRSEALLAPREGFGYRFSPGLSPELFVYLSERLDAMSSEKLPPEQRLECGKRFEHVLDAYYDVDGDGALWGLPPGPQRVRVSTPKEGQDTKGVASVKSKLASLDLYTGRRPGERGPALDLRVAIATEVVVEGFQPAKHHRLTLRREKVRKTYHFKAWRIDISTVLSTTPAAPAAGGAQPGPEWSPPVQTNEVELELDGYFLKRNLEAKRAGGRHMLWELLSDFLFTARDLAQLACELSPMRLPPALPAPSDAAVDGESREAFRRKFETEAEPVIGHYLYRLARPAPRAPAAKVPRTGAERRPP